MFFVYIDWTTEDVPRPFYVGKGNSKRVRTLARKNQLHTSIVRKHGQRREVVLTTHDEQHAFERERQLIKELKTCAAGGTGWWGANFTFGGEGAAGRIVSVATRQLLANSLRGRSRNCEAVLKSAAGHRGGGKPVAKLDDSGAIIVAYTSAYAAAEAHGACRSAVGNCCKGITSSCCGFQWRYLTHAECVLTFPGWQPRGGYHESRNMPQKTLEKE